MAFIFSKTVHEVIRNRNQSQLIEDKIQEKKRGNTAPQELPNLAIHGITSNGTYFFASLLYQKNLPERKKITIFNLIEAYANAKDHSEQVRLKSKIKEACGEQVEGIALLFFNSSETYGFVTGKNVKVARWHDTGPLELDNDELFSDSELERKLSLSFYYFVFILENEREDTPELIRQYIQGDERDDVINTDVINAIKYISTREKPLEDMSCYLKTAYAAIQNSALQQQVKAVYDALQLLDCDYEEIKYRATVLMIQLLHAQDNKERKHLLTEYTNLASELYGSKIPTLMIVSMSSFFLLASYLAFFIVIPPAIPFAIPLYLVIISGVFGMLGSLIMAIVGKNEYYNDEARQKRSTANTLFNLKKDLNNIPKDLIPEKIIDPSRYSGSRTIL